MRRAILVLLVLGCAGGGTNYHSTYKARNPDWHGEFPRAEASLHETLAGVYAPRTSDARIVVQRMEVVELGDGSPVVLAPEAVKAALEGTSGRSLAVIVTHHCQSQLDFRNYFGEKTSWYLLPDGKLTSYDANTFADDYCTSGNEFVPAPVEQAALEKQVIAYRDAKFPRSDEHVAVFYRHGIGYAKVGRVDDAREMLVQGDQAFDVASRGNRPSSRGQPSRTLSGTDEVMIQALRGQLRDAIRRAEKAAQG